MDVLEQIDFYKIREEVSRLCITEEGKNALSERKPLSDYKQIEILKSCSREWSHFISAGSSLPFNLWEPVKPLFEIIKTNGACLSLEQLYHIGQFCRAVEKTISLKTNIPAGCRGVFMTEGSPLFEEVTKLENLSEAFSVIFRIITQDGELKDLPEIAAIRKQIASLNQKIRTIMHGYVTDSKYQNILESNVPALKNGRQVLAIKAGQQNRINGIIHEVSGSGKTVFIEPEESVLCTNELIEKEFELKEEIKKVLTKATAELQPFVPVFRKNLPVMENLDCTYACAKYGIQNNCIYALPTLEEPPLLRQARHPLLGEKAVPIDIRFMDGKRVLIITGPNTGGKTVSLKTFALLSMMNQAGFPVPAEEGTRLPVFKNVFADIGDEQSLSQSLSTFSGHMKNIADACQNAGKYSLVLLDELGSGTDPQEGSAIAMAVLNHLIERKSFVLVTTHLGVLKNYGYTNENCINASVEFNSDTLSPSYKLLMGIPGESHALDIAARSGLPRFIVNNAKSYISTQQTDVSSLIKGLTKKHSELDRLRSQTDKEIQELEEKNLKLSEKEVNLRKKEHELKNNKTRELDEFIRKSRKELENLVRKIREGEITRDKTVSVKQFISELEANGHRLEDEVEYEEEQIRQAEL